MPLPPQSPEGLPEFENPPVVEVALAVQFDTLSNLRTPQMGALWQLFRERFPKTEEHPPLDPVFEQFGVAPRSRTSARLQVLSVPPTPRCWFLNQEGTELIQIQPDRFVHNWRKVAGSNAYPRYENVRAAFLGELQEVHKLLLSEELGDLRPNQCELTYVNHILSGEGWHSHGQLEHVLTLFGSRFSGSFQPQIEDCRMSARFVIPNEKGQPVGRLHIAVEPSFYGVEDVPMLTLTLTARGRPLADGLNGVLDFLDLGREWLVRTFAAITTHEMHAAWRRKR